MNLALLNALLFINLNFAARNVKRIQIIKYLQRFSFTLTESKELLDQKDANPDQCVDRNKAFKKKLGIIEKQIKELEETSDALIELVDN